MYISKNTKRVLSSIGYLAGKWVYLIDAFDDLEDDIKNHSYNPFINKKDRVSPIFNLTPHHKNCNVQSLFCF